MIQSTPLRLSRRPETSPRVSTTGRQRVSAGVRCFQRGRISWEGRGSFKALVVPAMLCENERPFFFVIRIGGQKA